MRKSYISTLFTGLLLSITSSLSAQVYEIKPEGELLFANDVSANGVVTLYSQNSNFYWTEANGLVKINSFDDQIGGTPSISNDGQVIAVSATNPANNTRELSKYFISTGTFNYLGSLKNSLESSVYAMTKDAKKIVGLGFISEAYANAIYWTENEGLVSLGSSFQNSSSRADNVSNDGTKITGWQDLANGDRVTVVWNNNKQDYIKDNEGNYLYGGGNISGDGNWIVSNNYLGLPAIWNSTKYFVLNHPKASTSYSGNATDISYDGKVVIGYFRKSYGNPDPLNGEGFIWTEKTGRINLNDYVKSLGLDDKGITFSLPLGISEDGKMIVGGGYKKETQEYVAFLLKLPINIENTGCLDSPNGQFPVDAYTPACSGSNELITDKAKTGQYSFVNVTANNTYIFSSSLETDFITISNENGTEIYSAGYGKREWKSSKNEKIRFYISKNISCEQDTATRSKYVRCGDLSPINCNDFVALSNDLENGVPFGSDANYRLATDIQVKNKPFTIYGIEPNFIGKATKVDFKIYKNLNGVPSELITTRKGIIKDEKVIGDNQGLEFIKYKVLFDSSLQLEANTTYWIEIITDALGWETTTAYQSILGNGDAINYTETSGEWANLGDMQFVFNLVCDDELSTDETSDNQSLKYFPNPVKDILNITNDKNIQKVEIVDITGKQVFSKEINAKNAQIKVDNLAKGIYIVKTISEGKVETFKIIKK